MKWEHVAMTVTALVLCAMTAGVIALYVFLVSTRKSVDDLDREVDDLSHDVATAEKKTKQLFYLTTNISSQVRPVNDTYDLAEIAAAICTAAVNDPDTEIYTIPRRCDADYCTDICSTLQGYIYECFETVHILPSPESADGKEILMATKYGSNGCISGTGCEPNFCCCSRTIL